ncbi:hypothetical protein ACF0H5_005981 [Mactra antiquata]
MADDIDDLLDEVEDKFVKQSDSKKLPTRVKPSKPKRDDDELSKIIDDICDEQEPPAVAKCNNSKQVVRQGSQSRPIVSKCFPVCIGGSAVSKGLGNTVNRRSCDRLRCTSCDFKVASFDDFGWDSSTDYLFLRNNAPDFERLKSKLSRMKGYRSYCCQCSHISVNDVTDVKDLPLKWVCGQH